jgi:hypothetical protein
MTIAAMFCMLPLTGIAQQPGESAPPDNSNTESPGTDFSKPFSMSLAPDQAEFDISNIEFMAEVDRDTLEKGLKAGFIPIRITVINHGRDSVTFSNAVTIPGHDIEIYAEDESYKKKLIFPASSKKVSNSKAATTEVPGGRSVSVLLQMPLPLKLLDPKYKAYLVCVHVYVPRLEHSFEVFSESFSIPRVPAN